MPNPKPTTTTLLLTLTLTLHANPQPTNQPTNQPTTYPKTKKVNQTDNYHGTTITDPYRWLETDPRQSQQIQNWIQTQNTHTQNYLQKLPHRQTIQKRLTQLWNYEKISPPTKHGNWYYFWKNNGLQNQHTLHRQKTLTSQPQLIIDPNTWSQDGTIALANISISHDGTYLAYSTQEAGSDWHTWKIMHTDTKTTLTDELKWIKFSNITWTKDNRGFFYSRYPTPPKNQTYQTTNKNQQLHYHQLGTPQNQDTLVYHRPDQPDWGFDPQVTEDGHYLIITIWKGTDPRHQILYRDLQKPYQQPIPLIENFQHEYTFIANDGPLLYFKTNHNAPNGRCITLDTRHPKQPPKEIIPQTKNTLTHIQLIGNTLITQYLQHAKTQIKIHNLNGTHLRDLKLPGIGTAQNFTGKRSHTETFYTYTSINTPPTTYRYDILTNQTQLIRQPKTQFNPNHYTVQQTFYHSKDGTQIPMFIAHKRDTKPNGNNPTLLYGYGGFNIPLTPQFSISRLLWMEMGGIYAQANLRGGGEYGKPWHQAGTKLQKQNVFDDFTAAAQYLIQNNYTNPKKLAIQGASNGGLLVAACMNQNPNLYAACLPAVGVMDMLRFHKFTAGRFWVDDYGSPDNPQEFQALYAYSPYHNLKPNHYPATLITTADTDDRVIPAHSFKYAARLQEYQQSNAPTLIRIETRAGHGAGKPTDKIIQEITDQWTFLVHNLNFNPNLPN